MRGMHRESLLECWEWCQEWLSTRKTDYSMKLEEGGVENVEGRRERGSDDEKGMA